MSVTQAADNMIEASRSADPSSENGRAGLLFPIVGIGASAGGLEAFTQLLSHLPRDTGMAFVLIQHLDPSHPSRLHELLAKTTSLPVLEVTDGLAPQPDHVYIIPKNTNMAIEGGVLKLTPRDASQLHLPIDCFFRSLAHDRLRPEDRADDQERGQAIGIVLSGTGTDGTLGLQELKARGGITFAENEASAKFPSMPQSAGGHGNADFVMSPEQIAGELARIGKHPYLAVSQQLATSQPGEDDCGQTSGAEKGSDEQSFRKIISLLRTTVGVDFTHYRDSTIKRRILRRMVLRNQSSLSEYIRLLESDSGELETLFHEVLINVTSFFRDPEVFDALKRDVFPAITKDKPPGTPIRIWSAGCSTGQEAYSIAMVLLEFLEDCPQAPQIQIFASDLSDSVALAKARVGRYPESIEAEVSPQRLRRFFTKEEGTYRINKSIRDLCIFAKQNIVADPPFSRVDLISCRNVLIYLSPTLQKRVIPTFHYALNSTGYLLLGTSESTGSFSDLFEVVDRSHRIYYKKKGVFQQYPHFNTKDRFRMSHSHDKAITHAAVSPADFQREADRIVLGQYAPAGVLVNESLEILQFRGRTSPYLEPASGAASLNLLKMARDGLFVDLKSAIEEAQAGNVTTVRSDVLLRDGQQSREISLRVSPIRLHAQSELCYLVLFEEGDAAGLYRQVEPSAGSVGGRMGSLGRWIRRLARRGARAGVDSSPSPDTPDSQLQREVLQLRRELEATREQHQTVSERHDTANEELKSANEEILSANEELQSTNEELETAKEELQSVNEELTTVNEQLNSRNQELTLTSDDLNNLLTSAGIPIVMLGCDLRIRRFTPLATEVLKITTADVDRPIGDVKLGIELPDLETLLEEVLATVQVSQREVSDRRGHWYLVRMHPYRTADNKIDGAVLVFLDIHEAKMAQFRLQQAHHYTDGIVQTIREPLLVLTNAFTVKSANQAFYDLFRVTPQDTELRSVYELGDGQWNQPQLRNLLAEVLGGDQAFNDYEVQFDFPHIGTRIILLNARRLVQSAVQDAEQDSHQDTLILLAMEDITDRKQHAIALQSSEKKYHQLFDRIDEGFCVLEKMELPEGEPLDFRYLEANAAFTTQTGIDDLVGSSMRQKFPDLSEEWYETFEHVLATGEPIRFERELDDRGRILDLFAFPVDEQFPRRIAIIFNDVTERVEAANRLRENAATILEADHHKDQFLAMLGHELRNPLSSIVSGLQVLRQGGLETDDEQEMFDVIARQSALMTRLIDDLLDMSRVSAGKIRLQRRTMDLVAMIRHVVADHQHHAKENQLTLSCDLPSSPICFHGDAARLSQVIKNLLNNATKFTDAGGSLHVTAAVEHDRIKIEVRDTGIGMDAATIDTMFQAFRQADSSIDRSRGGLGLGMALSKRLIKLHRGELSAHSDGLGHGACFRIELPFDPQATIASVDQPDSAAAPLRSHRVLIVDDQRSLRLPMRHLLKSLGQECMEAEDGSTALRVAGEFLPEIIWCDIGLPDMDGYAVARAIRGNPELSHIYLVAVTGYGQDDDRRQAQEAGFDRHITKPISVDALRDVVATYELESK